MDMRDKSNLEPEKRNEESANFSPSGMFSDWRFNDANLASSSMGLVSCSSGAMVDSFGQTVWERPVNVTLLGFSEMNVHSGGAISSDPLSMLRSGITPNMPVMLAHNLSQFPADSAFIERAARFSSFSGGHFGELSNPFGNQQSGNPYVRGEAVMQGHQELLSGNSIQNMETLKDVSVPPEHGAVEASSPKNVNDSNEPEFSGGGTQRNTTASPAKGLGVNKRKRVNQDNESDQANGTLQQSDDTRKTNSEMQQKGEQNSAATGNKSNGKHGKQSSQNSDPPKDEYIHVRARRGQATNSHSLAERVRREKISERMKFLQDLVPGCSKVTGKAVMLDEIINYVQSLQRQVEFLSMKLATVNPRLDCDIEQLLGKDHMLSARSGPSGIGISPSMPMAYPQLHPSQAPILQPGLPRVGNFSDILRRTINSHMTNMGGGYKEPTHQLPNTWDDELHNVVQMGFNGSPPLDNQEANCPAVDQGPTEDEP